MIILFNTLFLFLLAVNSIKCNLSSRDNICWEPGILLHWNDFKGKHKPGNLHAHTSITIKIDMISRNKVIVQNCMIRGKSWVNSRAKNNELLEHEQYHFNLSEIFARQMRKEISLMNAPSITELKNIFDKWMKELHISQELYDKETNHSIILSEQVRWQNKIDDELRNSENFSNKTVILKN